MVRVPKVKIKIDEKKILDTLANPRIGSKYQTKYSEDIKVMAVAMRAQGASYSKIQEAIGVPCGTVSSWVNGQNIDNDSISLVAERLSGTLKDRLMLNAQTAMSSAMTDEKIEKASFKDLVIGGSIMIDKSRLLSGESTENISYLGKKIIEVKDARSLNDTKISLLDAEITQLESANPKKQHRYS